MAEITLGGKSRTISTLKVNIGEKSYDIPLAGSLTLDQIEAFKNGEDELAFFGKYIPNKVMKSLTTMEFKQLNDAWKQASEEETGVKLGE